MLYCYGVHCSIENEKRDGAASRPLTLDALTVLDRTFRHGMLVEVRALYDRDISTLGSKRLAHALAHPAERARVDQYLEQLPHVGVMPDVSARHRYLDYVQRYCEVMSEDDDKSTSQHHPLAAKIRLVRRNVGKTVAHSTLDECPLSGHDLHDVVVATVVISCAIEAALGDAATSVDLAQAETASWRAGAALLGVERYDDTPYLVNMVRGFLPMWVATGNEGPDYPLKRPNP